MATGIEITVQAYRAIISLQIAASTMGDLLLVFLFAPVFTRWTAHLAASLFFAFNSNQLITNKNQGRKSPKFILKIHV